MDGNAAEVVAVVAEEDPDGKDAEEVAIGVMEIVAAMAIVEVMATAGVEAFNERESVTSNVIIVRNTDIMLVNAVQL
jgi:hypothetical protein